MMTADLLAKLDALLRNSNSSSNTNTSFTHNAVNRSRFSFNTIRGISFFFIIVTFLNRAYFFNM